RRRAVNDRRHEQTGGFRRDPRLDRDKSPGVALGFQPIIALPRLSVVRIRKRAEMYTRYRTRVAPVMLAIAASTLVIVQPSAQGARPPDITGNWRLDNAEDPGQPPLA